MQLNGHPAPGLRGEILPGWYTGISDIVSGPDQVDFVVPQNPFKPVSYQPRIGDIVSQGVQFVVPQNPLKSQLTGNVKPIGTGSYDCGCGCGGHGGCGSKRGQLNGISQDFTQFSTDFGAGNFQTAFLTDTIMGIPTIGWVAAIGVLVMMQGTSGSRRR